MLRSCRDVMHSVTRVLSLMFVAGVTATGLAAEDSPIKQAERPYLTFFVSSYDRVRNACEMVFDSIDRPDLAQSMGERLTGFGSMTGIDPTRPIGIMTTWDDEKPLEVVFVPKSDLEELLKTATFGVVGFHQVTPDHYEIERPGSPYHVLIQKDYALFADSVSTIRALRVSPLKLTQGVRDRYDVGMKADLLQIPQPTKTRWVAELRQQLEPWLQPQDNEDEEQARIKKTVGKLVLDVIERVVNETKSVTIGCRLEPKDRHLVFELSVEGVARSRLAAILNQLKTHHSEYTALVQSEAAAGIAMNLPLDGIWEQLRGSPREAEEKPSRLEIGLQLVGTRKGELSLIAALHGPDIEGMNTAIPRWLEKLENVGQLADFQENFDIHNGVVLHSLIPRDLPDTITHWTGTETEIIVGQSPKTLWVGIGQPDPLLGRLRTAIDLVADAPEHKLSEPALKGRFSAKALPDLVAIDLFNSDPDAAEKEFSRGDDGFSLTVEPFLNGLKLRIELEEGFTRLIGRGWVKQIEDSQPR